jgi:hypothetical protein
LTADQTETPRRSVAGGWRRWTLLGLGIGGITLGIWQNTLDQQEGGGQFASNSLLRIGIVMIALWLALPTLKKPISWVPPGVVVVCLVAVGAVAAQPKLIFVIAPAVGLLLTLGGFARFFRGR